MATPEAAARVWTMRPVQSPSVITHPARRPRMAACDNTTILSGPGERASSVDDEKKRASELVGIKRMLLILYIVKF